MKVTVKKLLKFGLEKDDIKAEFGLNEEQIERYERQGRIMKVDNLPELLEKYNTDKIIKSVDRDKAELFNKLFNITNSEIPNLDITKKREIIDAIPRFIDDIERKMAEEEIKKLEEQISTIKQQINNICSENSMPTRYSLEENTTPQKVEIKEKIWTLGTDIYLQSTSYKFGANKIGFSLRKNTINEINMWDVIKVKNDEKTYRYKVVSKVNTTKNKYVKCLLYEQD